MWFTWGALSLLVFDLALQVTGTVDFAAVVWVTLAVTLIGAVAVDRRRGARIVPR
jgi:hypothetical protein